MMSDDTGRRLQQFLDREELFDLVRRERFARDQRHFAVMRDCFEDDAYVQTSWYDGYGGDAYVEASRKRMGTTDNSKHWVFPAAAQIAGDRATVESPAMIFNRVVLDGLEVDFHVFCRFFSRSVRRTGHWRLQSFVVIWERDVMRPVPPADRLPLDWALVSTLRASYRFLAYYQKSRGVDVNPDLPGDDRRDLVDAFYAKEERWLAGSE